MLAQSSVDAPFAHSVLQWYEKFGRKPFMEFGFPK